MHFSLLTTPSPQLLQRALAINLKRTPAWRYHDQVTHSAEYWHERATNAVTACHEGAWELADSFRREFSNLDIAINALKEEPGQRSNEFKEKNPGVRSTAVAALGLSRLCRVLFSPDAEHMLDIVGPDGTRSIVPELRHTTNEGKVADRRIHIPPGIIESSMMFPPSPKAVDWYHGTDDQGILFVRRQAYSPADAPDPTTLLLDRSYGSAVKRDTLFPYLPA